MDNPYIKLHREFRVAALAIEQDVRMQEDQHRIDSIRIQMGDYARDFTRLRVEWRKSGTLLEEQHRQLMSRARNLLGEES